MELRTLFAEMHAIALLPSLEAKATETALNKYTKASYPRLSNNIAEDCSDQQGGADNFIYAVLKVLTE